MFRAILDGKPQGEIDAISEKYDYFEIPPAANVLYSSINKKIAELAEKHGKLCAATGNVHYKDKEDKIIREIILEACGADEYYENDQTQLFFRTTDEMLGEFEYLGREKTFEIVVTNTNATADMIDADIYPIPKGTFTLSIPNTEAELSRFCWENAHTLFGGKLPEIIESRLARELDLIAKNGFSAYYLTAVKLAERSPKKRGYRVGFHGSVGSMLTAFLSHITDTNPLLPHYLCPKCKSAEFITILCRS